LPSIRNDVCRYGKNTQVHIFYIVLVIAIFLFLRQCGQGLGILNGGKKIPDTISVKTIIKEVPVKGDTVYVPEIVGVSNTIYVPRTLHDTLTEFEVRVDPADTAAILARYFQKAYYKDVQKVGAYGSVTIFDTVSENRIVSRRFVTDLKIPEKTTVVTLRDKRTIGYLDIAGIGNPTNAIYGISAGFSLKLKNDKQYGGGLMYSRDNVLYYYGKFSLPIRLKHR